MDAGGVWGFGYARPILSVRIKGPAGSPRPRSTGGTAQDTHAVPPKGHERAHRGVDGRERDSRPAVGREAGRMTLSVETMAVDAVAFRDLWRRCQGDPVALAQEIEEQVRIQGRAHFPASGTGATFGGILEPGEEPSATRGPDQAVYRADMRVATLDPLSGGSLLIHSIQGIVPHLRQVRMRGLARLDEGIRLARIPHDWPLEPAVAVLGVADVVARVHRTVMPDDRVLILGASGTAGMLATFAASERVGPRGLVVAQVPCPGQLSALGDLPERVQPVVANAADRSATVRSLLEATGGHLADLAMDCTTERGTEKSVLACIRPFGSAWFVNLAASAARARDDEHGRARQVRLDFGCGAEAGAAEGIFALVQRHSSLRQRFGRRAGARMSP